MDRAFGDRQMNCASGLSGELGHPVALQRELERNGNERVFGLAIYGPKLRNFVKTKSPVFAF